MVIGLMRTLSVAVQILTVAQEERSRMMVQVAPACAAVVPGKHHLRPCLFSTSLHQTQHISISSHTPLGYNSTIYDIDFTYSSSTLQYWNLVSKWIKPTSILLILKLQKIFVDNRVLDFVPEMKTLFSRTPLAHT